ncbi:MAG TPA: hypothetical protein VFF29_00095 [Bacteroidota bacterium]|nr:hypothetical protein [Bacteroidota bacterium]
MSIYTKRWQEDDWKEGLLGVGFLFVIFSVGWSIATVIMKLVINEKGFGEWLNRDTLSLMLLTVMEGVFFYVQLKKRVK